MSLLLKILLWAGAFICGLVSLWLAFCIFGIWFIGPPPDLSMTPAHNVLLRLGMTGLLIGLSFVFGTLSRLTLRKGASYPPQLKAAAHPTRT